MRNDEQDLRATIDAIVTDAERLKEIEEQKRSLAPDATELVELSAEAHEIAADLPAKTEAQSVLVDRLAEGDAVDA